MVQAMTPPTTAPTPTPTAAPDTRPLPDGWWRCKRCAELVDRLTVFGPVCWSCAG